LLSSWFNPGFLKMHQVDWKSPAEVLEKLIQHEAVHAIDGWDDLRRRLQPDRRCFAFFHPQLPSEPLIFVEVALLPEIPTVAEAGNLPGYQITAWFGLFVPAGTPASAVSRLNAAVRRAGEQADLRERLSSGFGMVVSTSTPEEAAAFVKAETQRWTSAIRPAGIEPE
jgi:tripartite-type tricarboxylate transporter receptor subunit TctC